VPGCFIFLLEKEPKGFQRFTLYHEIGHTTREGAYTYDCRLLRPIAALSGIWILALLSYSAWTIPAAQLLLSAQVLLRARTLPDIIDELQADRFAVNHLSQQDLLVVATAAKRGYAKDSRFSDHLNKTRTKALIASAAARLAGGSMLPRPVITPVSAPRVLLQFVVCAGLCSCGQTQSALRLSLAGALLAGSAALTFLCSRRIQTLNGSFRVRIQELAERSKTLKAATSGS
jgi:hypothetical protein